MRKRGKRTITINIRAQASHAGNVDFIVKGEIFSKYTGKEGDPKNEEF